MRALDLVPAYRRGFEAAVGETLRLLADVPAADMCGLSLGGLVALRVAAERRREDDRLTACAAFDRLPANVRRRVRALALAARVMQRRFLQRQLVAELPERHQVRALEEIAPFRRAEISRLMWQAAGSVVDPQAIVAPVLVLCGERDRPNLPLARRLADALPRGTLEIVANAGHVANLDNPEAFSALL